MLNMKNLSQNVDIKAFLNWGKLIGNTMYQTNFCTFVVVSSPKRTPLPSMQLCLVQLVLFLSSTQWCLLLLLGSSWNRDSEEALERMRKKRCLQRRFVGPSRSWFSSESRGSLVQSPSRNPKSYLTIYLQFWTLYKGSSFLCSGAFWIQKPVPLGCFWSKLEPLKEDVVRSCLSTSLVLKEATNLAGIWLTARFTPEGQPSTTVTRT